MDSLNCRRKHIFHYMLLGFVLILMGVLFANAQNSLPKAEEAADAAQEKVKSAIKKGKPLTHVSSTDVTGNISVEATLIPANITRTVFGKEIGNNYAVIGLTVSNRSADQAFIVHSIFIDYSQWLLSGGSPFLEGNALCLQGTQAAAPSSSETLESTKSMSTPVGGTPGSPETQKPEAVPASGTAPKSQGPQNIPPQSCSGNQLQTWQQQTFPNQIASIESRIIREELLIKQPWTTRNWVLRALQAAGSVATGFTFAASSQSWIQGIGAFNGSVIPAYQQFWPDSTVSQMNQISNVGFQVNKAIAKQSSDIIVAFFPIDRFLTPDLKSLFISSPAAFFSPIEALLDQKTRNKVAPYLAQLFGAKDLQGKDIPEGQENEIALFANLLKFLPHMQYGACQRYQNSQRPLDQSQLMTNRAQGRKDKEEENSGGQEEDKNQVTNGNHSQPGSMSAAENNLEMACLTAAVINRLSLNTVRVIVGGTMTVDVNNVPPQIASVDIEAPTGETTSSMWTLKIGVKNATLNGTIHGSFLGGATPTLVSPPSGVTIKAVAQGASDTELPFTLTLTSSLPANTKSLSFQVSKSSSSGSTIKSATYDYQVEQTQQAPAPEGGKGEGSSAASSRFPSAPEKPNTPRVTPPKK